VHFGMLFVQQKPQCRSEQSVKEGLEVITQRCRLFSWLLEAFNAQ